MTTRATRLSTYKAIDKINAQIGKLLGTTARSTYVGFYYDDMFIRGVMLHEQRLEEADQLRHKMRGLAVDPATVEGTHEVGVQHARRALALVLLSNLPDDCIVAEIHGDEGKLTADENALQWINEWQCGSGHMPVPLVHRCLLSTLALFGEMLAQDLQAWDIPAGAKAGGRMDTSNLPSMRKFKAMVLMGLAMGGVTVETYGEWYALSKHISEGYKEGTVQIGEELGACLERLRELGEFVAEDGGMRDTFADVYASAIGLQYARNSYEEQGYLRDSAVFEQQMRGATK